MTVYTWFLTVALVFCLTNVRSGNSEFEQGGSCRIEKNRYGDKPVKMRDGSNVTGIKVHFKPNMTCSLRGVEEFRGLKYGVLKPSEKYVFRFMRNKDVGHQSLRSSYATNYKPVCPQLSIDAANPYFRRLPKHVQERMINIATSTNNQSEECLWINIFVPDTEWNETEKLPVMIFIHGESYKVGTGNAYDGSVLASYGGVIVITVNYRLGVLGFLSTGDSEAEGNYALWDLIAILYWVNQNIGEFGGDQRRVTLFGHGHGAALVNLLLLTNSAMDYDLFNNVILQSGSALSTWATSIDAKRCAHRLAQRVNCSNAINNSKDLVACFREKGVDELVSNVPLTPKYFTCFAPSIDKDMDGTMFPAGKSIEDLIRSRDTRFGGVKMMVGLTKKEAYSSLSQNEIENGITETRKKQILRTYIQNVYRYNRQKIYDVLDHEYTDWDRPIDNYSRRDSILDMLSDAQYKAPLIKVAQEHSKLSDTYFYSFGYSTQSENFPQWSGGVHGDELPYVFGAPLVGGLSPFPFSYNAQEMELSKFMMRMWTNFAKTGDPNLPKWDDHDRMGQEYKLDSGWPKYNISTQNYLHIGRKGAKIKEFYRGRESSLWNALIPKLNKRDINSSDASHQLEQANNDSTFDEPSRLINKFWTIFPTPPPPPFTPPCNPMMDTSYVSQENLDPDNVTEEPTTHKPPVVHPEDKSQTNTEAPLQENSKQTQSSGIPLSVVVVIGCSLLFLNLLIFAGIYYYHRRRKSKPSGPVTNMNSVVAGDMRQVNDYISGDRHINSHAAESHGLVQTMDKVTPHGKVAGINHKPISGAPPVYTPISKPMAPGPGPGGYNYSALPQKTSSPMHSHPPTPAVSYAGPPVSHPPSGASSDDGSQVSRGSNSTASRAPPGGNVTDLATRTTDSGKPDNRTKAAPRTTHSVTSSNNAITIV